THAAPPATFTLSLHDALPICAVDLDVEVEAAERATARLRVVAVVMPCGELHRRGRRGGSRLPRRVGRGRRRLPWRGAGVGRWGRSEEHTSDSSHLGISYAVFC